MKTFRGFLCLAFAASLVAPLLHAEDWTTTDGKVYQQVQVISSKPDSVTILHQDGGAAVPMEKLPPDIQKRFNYDPEKAKAYRAAQNKPAASKQLAAGNPAQGSPKAGTPVAATNPMDDPENVIWYDSSTTTAAPTASSAPAPESSPAPAPTATDSTHHSVDELSGTSGTLRRNLNDPNYHTMAHLTTTVQSLGPDPSDKNHHSMNDLGNGL